MVKKKKYGDTLKEQLKASAKDRLYNFLLADGTVRGVIVNGTRMVNEMRANHELGVLETLALGHAYLGAGLMSANLKGNDRLSFQIECSGPIKGLYVETNAFGEVRGYLKQVPIPIEKPLESFDLSPFFGAGFLTVTKYLEDAKHPFSGQVMLQYGTIAKDLAYYFLKSEQIPTAFHLSIQFDRRGEVTGAGGLFLQSMPDADEQVAAGLEDLMTHLPSLGTEFSREMDTETLIQTVFRGWKPVILGSHRIEFMCHCNEAAIRSMLLLLPQHDLKDMKENGPFPIEIRCQNCHTPYYFTQSDLQQIHHTRFPRN